MSFGVGVVAGFLLAFFAMCGLVTVAWSRAGVLLDKLEGIFREMREAAPAKGDSDV